jgi:hypothetical protein
LRLLLCLLSKHPLRNPHANVPAHLTRHAKRFLLLPLHLLPRLDLLLLLVVVVVVLLLYLLWLSLL